MKATLDDIQHESPDSAKVDRSLRDRNASSHGVTRLLWLSSGGLVLGARRLHRSADHQSRQRSRRKTSDLPRPSPRTHLHRRLPPPHHRQRQRHHLRRPPCRSALKVISHWVADRPLNVADQLKQALATYSESGGQGSPIIGMAQAVAMILEKYEFCCWTNQKYFSLSTNSLRPAKAG